MSNLFSKSYNHLRVTPIIYEHARIIVPSSAKLGFIIKRNINLEHKIHSFIYLTDTCRCGMTEARAARIIDTL